MIQSDRLKMTIWLISLACWIPKATNTHSEYVILIALPLKQWLHKSASMLRYMYIASLVVNENWCLMINLWESTKGVRVCILNRRCKIKESCDYSLSFCFISVIWIALCTTG